MCGILGQINFNDTRSPHPELNLIGHRGPDGNGEWTSEQGNVYFGHTRLAILDPSPAGHQPMNDASARFTITFNGEIYNHFALRRVLPAIDWRGSSDTETLIELFARHGLLALNELKGMFAFAIYDRLEDSVLLVRDRFGIKPLWFRKDHGRFIFSSEVRPLLKHDKKIINKKALSEYIAFGRMPATIGIFENIEAVAPGSWIKVMSTGVIRKGCWWTPCGPLAKPMQSYEACKMQVHQLVSGAVNEHLISDVGVGSFLSGGIDSSIVTLVAAKAMGRNLKTFTVGFPQGAKDERQVASLIAKQAGTEHTEIEVSEANCLKWVKEAVLNLDLPSVDAINTYIVSKAVSDCGLKVALSGLGGDELFGGYPSFRNVARLAWLKRLPQNVRDLALRRLSPKLWEKLGSLSSFSQISLTIAHRRFTSIKALEDMGLHDGTPDIAPAPLSLDDMGQISWAEIYGYMIPMLLRDSDQMSMATGLEIRVPFLDHVLVEEVLLLPEKYKKGKNTKSLLIDAFREELPREVYDRPKQGFALPMDLWIRGPLHEFAEEGTYAAAEILGISVPLHQKEKFDNRKVHWTRIWNWCVLGHWLSKEKIATEKLPERTGRAKPGKSRPMEIFQSRETGKVNML